MDSPLDAVAVRVLGSLIEKEITTPDNYPLTLNALVAACNQTSNRDPVVSFDDATVSRSLEELRRRSLVRAVQRSDSRVTRYQQLLSEHLTLGAAETAALCVLMLRGAQTVGEIKTRAGRLFDFTDLAQAESTLDALMARVPSALATRLPRRPGQKEVRYAHLLSGEPSVEVSDSVAASEPRESDRVEALEQSVDALRAELADLRAQFQEFRREFQ